MLLGLEPPSITVGFEPATMEAMWSADGADGLPAEQINLQQTVCTLTITAALPPTVQT